MDVQLGHCWRCEKALPQDPVHCSHCRLAVYCTPACRTTDAARHGSVECQVFRPKKCGACGKTGDVKECAHCNAMWYCNKECQKNDWAVHKASCKKVVAAVRSGAGSLCIQYSFNKVLSGDFPYYIGNVVATDFLQLNTNEWYNKNQLDEELGRDYHVLSAGCGNLRNTVLTAASLPTRYRGKLHITLNDTDPFVTARNVLFLFMLARFADSEGIASSLTTIWYSLHISESDYNLIKTSLDELIPMSGPGLRDITGGLVSVQGKDMVSLRQVWEGWRALECRRDKKDSINLRQQRKALFEEKNVEERESLFLNEVPKADRDKMKKWLDHALFVPADTKKRDLTFANPTLTGRQRQSLHAATMNTFVYSVNVDAFPFTEWDCMRVRECTSGLCPSPMVMYHNYVTNCLQKVSGLVLQGRLHINVSLASCLDFPSKHETARLPNYDRIFTSNLADYFGIGRLLRTFKPLLNADNSFSVIVTEFMNWFGITPDADIESVTGTPEYERCLLAYQRDTKKMFPPGVNYIEEYYNNTTSFLVYLRASIMAGGHGIQALHDVPQYTHVKKYNGMRMRDFRGGLNKLVPFRYRMNVRDLTLLNGRERAVEWCLPNSNT